MKSMSSTRAHCLLNKSRLLQLLQFKNHSTNFVHLVGIGWAQAVVIDPLLQHATHGAPKQSAPRFLDFASCGGTFDGSQLFVYQHRLQRCELLMRDVQQQQQFAQQIN